MKNLFSLRKSLKSEFNAFVKAAYAYAWYATQYATAAQFAATGYTSYAAAAAY